MGIFLCCVCDFFLIQKIGIFWSCIIHFHFQNSLIILLIFLRAFLLKFFTRIFLCFSLFVSFIHAAFRIWKNNSFTTELSEAFKYRAVTVDKRIFFYLNLPYCSIFTLFFLLLRKWKKLLYFLVITGYIFCLIMAFVSYFFFFFANFWKSTVNLSKKILVGPKKSITILGNIRICIRYLQKSFDEIEGICFYKRENSFL